MPKIFDQKKCEMWKVIKDMLIEKGRLQKTTENMRPLHASNTLYY